MNMVKISKAIVVGFGLCMASGMDVSFAQPTGAPLFHFPLHPCRVLDTRTSIGPLVGGNAMDVYVRGNQLLSSHGAQRADCGVPPEAEAVIINVTAIQPNSVGNLKLHATGWVHGPMGNYSRLNYAPAENAANEMTVSLCNTYIYPTTHEACGTGDPSGRYTDFQIWNSSAPTTTLHIVADVVGYLARE